MHPVILSGSGLWVAPHTITNDELVASYNAYAQAYNAQHAAAIVAGEQAALPESNAAFIEKASGIRQRYVIDKEGVLDPQRMRPRLVPRPDDELSLMAEIAVDAGRQALEAARCDGRDLDLVICAASNMQRAYPAMAIEIQHALGAGGHAFDMNVACSSATFGISQAVNAIATGQVRRALVVNPELAAYLGSGYRSQMLRLSWKYWTRIRLIGDENVAMDEFRFLTKDGQEDLTNRYFS